MTKIKFCWPVYRSEFTFIQLRLHYRVRKIILEFGTNPRRHRGVDAIPSGFPRITRERIGRSPRNLVYLTIEQFYTFPEKFKSVPTTTFDLWPDFQGHVKRNLYSVPFQRLKLANFDMFAGDMDMDRCWKVTSMVYSDIVTLSGSTEVIRSQWPLMTSYVIFLLPGVLWCADFEFGIRLPFICVEIGSLES